MCCPVICLVVFFIWYFLLTDRDIYLFFCERFGKSVARFSDKVVWVTGATSGLSKAMAYELATVGTKLILSARHSDALQQVKADCLEKSKGKLRNEDILLLSFDISDVKKIYVEEAIKYFGKIDILINNNGHMQLGEAAGIDINMDKALFDVSFFGSVFLSKELIKHFLEHGGGKIVVISSLAGKYGVPGQATYSASKHALQGYFDSLRLEIYAKNIDVTMVCLGLYKSSLSDESVLTGYSKIPLEELDKFQRKAMKTERCAHLTLLAAINNLTECWIANQPFLCLTAIAQYAPGFHKYIMKFIFNEKRLAKVYEGKWPGFITWKPLFTR